MTKKSTNPGGKELREPGFWESLKETFLGVRRRIDCVQVEVTSRCLGLCTYCPHTTMRGMWQSHDMPMDAFSRLWPLMRCALRVHLQGWGEPLLNPAFFEMAALARKAGCLVSTTTCGLRINTAIAEKIVDSGIDIVAFSLAGTDAETNAVRRGVEFDQVCEAVAVLQSVRRARMGVHLEIHIAYLMLASSMEAVAGLPDLMQRLGVHAAVISTLDYIPGPHLEAEAFLPQESEKIARAEAILGKTAATARKLGLGFHYQLPHPDAPGNTCRENVARSLFVSADGWVSPCVYVNVPASRIDPNRRVFGNIREQDPLAIWESDGFRRFRDRLSGNDPDLCCRSCPKRFMKR